MRTLLHRWLFAAVWLLALGGCSYYSFTGASIPEHLRTIAIPLVEDNSTSPLTNLGEILTQRLINRLVGQTRLALEPDETAADAILSARIDRYANEPTAVSGTERAELNRVTISVSVQYEDRVQNEQLLQRTFTGFAEYDPNGPNGLQGEIEAAQIALDNIADDIFTAATSNW